MRIARPFATLCLCTASAAWAAGGGQEPSGESAATPYLASAQKAIDAKDWATAQRQLDQALRVDWRSADGHNLMGYVLRKRDKPDLAKSIDHYTQALRIDPRHKGAHEYIGEAYLMDNKPAEAEKHLVQLERICGGKACEEYRDLAKSIDAYKAAKK